MVAGEPAEPVPQICIVKTEPATIPVSLSASGYCAGMMAAAGAVVPVLLARDARRGDVNVLLIVQIGNVGTMVAGETAETARLGLAV